jgi:NADH-quinone oxidoreductase subunit G
MAADELLTLTINGIETKAEPRTLLIHLLRRMDIVVPTLCHDERLTPYGGCRLCVVSRRDGRGGLVPACSTPVQNGMEIETDAPEVLRSRKQQLQLLVLNHRLECPVCDSDGDCRFQDLLYEYGALEDQPPFERRSAPRDLQSPVIVRDPEKCILCGKCVRICDEIQGVAAIGITERGRDARVATLLERPLDCEFCGQCVNACPVGALVARPYTSEVPVWQRSEATTTCSYCSCGCQITVETHDGDLVRVRSEETSRPNHGKLCAKGWLGWDVLEDPARLRSPMLKRNGRLVPVSWDEALEAVAAGYQAAQERGRPVVGLGSTRLTCEDAYLMQRFVRGVTRSPHVDVGPGTGVEALVDGVGAVTGTPTSTATLEDMAAADLVLVLRADPTRTHPLVKTELVQGVRQRGQELLMAHALSGGLERHASVFLPIEPGGEDTLLSALAAHVLRRRETVPEPVRSLPGFPEWSSSLQAFTPDVVAGRLGVPEDRIAAMAGKLGAADSLVIVIVAARGIPGDAAAVARNAAHLMTLLDREKPGSGLLILGEKANAQGIVDVGLHPKLLPGHRRARDAAARAEVGSVWGSEPPAGVGWTSPEALAHAGRGEVGVLHIAGQDPLAAWSDGSDPRAALESADFVVVQDAFLTETARQADVVLPVRVLANREGTLVGADGVRRPLERLPISGPSLPQDGDVFVELARRLGASLPRGRELAREIDRLVQRGPRRPAVTCFAPIAPPPETAVRDGMRLDVSPQLFHSGSVTRRSVRLQELAPTDAARLSPADARKLGAETGDVLRVAIDGQEFLVRARIDRTVRRGTLILHRAGGTINGTASLIAGPDRVVAAIARRSE